jgi:Tfp pilus assembly protein PilZ
MKDLNAEIESLDLVALVDRLADLEQRRAPVGWSRTEAVERVTIERRIMSLVGAIPPEGEERRRSVRLPCHVTVHLRSKQHTVRAEVDDIGTGGVFVRTHADFPVGTEVEMEVIGADAEDLGVKVRGEVAWRSTKHRVGVGVSFRNRPTAAHERQLRRFVIELLRHRVAAQS